MKRLLPNGQQNHHNSISSQGNSSQPKFARMDFNPTGQTSSSITGQTSFNSSGNLNTSGQNGFNPSGQNGFNITGHTSSNPSGFNPSGQTSFNPSGYTSNPSGQSSLNTQTRNGHQGLNGNHHHQNGSSLGTFKCNICLWPRNSQFCYHS